MDLNAEGHTVAENASQLNETIDWSLWNGIMTIQERQLDDCSMAKVLYFNGSYVILHPWDEILMVEPLCNARKNIIKFAFWLVLVTGVPGNALALITILSLPRCTSTFYVALLSAFDLMQVVMKSTDGFLNEYSRETSASCKILNFLNNFTGTYANWILVLICFERFFSIRFPLKKNSYLTLRRAKTSAVALAIVLLPFYIIHFWVIDADGKGKCIYTDYKAFFSDVWLYVEIVLYIILPALLLFIMVIMIAREFKKVQKKRKTFIHGVENSSSGSPNAMVHRQLREQARMERSITIMLFFAAITFLVLCLPVSVVTPLYHAWKHNFRKKPHWLAQWELAHSITVVMAYLSHAINFFIYFFSGVKFRARLFRLLHCSCCIRKSSNGFTQTLQSNLHSTELSTIRYKHKPIKTDV